MKILISECVIREIRQKRRLSPCSYTLEKLIFVCIYIYIYHLELVKFCYLCALRYVTFGTCQFRYKGVDNIGT